VNQYIEEKSKSALFSQDNKQLYLYFIMPLLLGILLGDGLGIDISEITAKHIGLLRFIKSAGIDIRTKSLIFVLYLVFAPCHWYYFFKRRKSTPFFTYRLKTTSVSHVLKLLLGAFLMGLAAYALIIIGPDEDKLIKPSRQIRLLLASSKWDVSFAIYIGLILWASTLMILFMPVMLINDLVLRLKHRIK